ncbi:MAG: hypothetical protein M1832_002754 [Thelocarpon impressellum]|nr:MAG: hypothetical protein M1832_002754 [Thelocarpon impressellum]
MPVLGDRWPIAGLPMITDDGYTSIGYGRSVQCGVDENPRDQNATELQGCLDDYGNQISVLWPGKDCGGRGFYIGRYAYLNHNDCYRTCKPCIENAISNGHSGARCIHLAAYGTGKYGFLSDAFSMCWMGYH